MFDWGGEEESDGYECWTCRIVSIRGASPRSERVLALGQRGIDGNYSST